jgi:hypothetical protein
MGEPDRRPSHRQGRSDDAGAAIGPAQLLAIGLISAAVLAFEVLLMRLYAIVGWHHFAYMMISIALLGFGASGTALVVFGGRLARRFPAGFAGCAALFGLASVASVALALRLPFNPLAIVWEPGQLLWLGLGYAALLPPFFFAATALGLAFTRFPQAIGRLYACDLVGAGLGALGVVGLLFVLTPEATLRAIAALGLAAAALALWAPGRAPPPATLGLAVSAVLMALWLPPGWTALRPAISEYKGLPMALSAPDARIVDERSSPLGLIDVVESPTIPFRHAPGLSLNNRIEPPEQRGVFTDADALSAITRFDGDTVALGYLDYTTAAAPYHLLPAPKTLILGAGAGEQVLLAILHRAPEIDAVELNPQIVALIRENYAAFAGGIYGRPEVEVRVDEARRAVRRSDERYDLIQIPLLYSFGAAAAGTQSLHENYTYTVEAITDYLAALEPGGILSVTLWLELPPRDGVKLFATAVEALTRLRVADPGARLAMIRSWSSVTLLVKHGAFEARDIAALRGFATARSFDIAWAPGLDPAETNRFNILERPYLYEAATALLGPDPRTFLEDYKFAVAPATDDRPYFFDFFKWRFLPELLRLGPQGAAALLDMGYLILFATLVQAAALSAALILAPLALRRRRLGGAVPRARVAGYFLALGLGFLFLEIAFIQRCILFLGHPLYAVAVVLAGFLVFAGVGSALAPALDRRVGGRARPIAVAAVAIAAVATAYLAILPPLFEALSGLTDAGRIAVTLALIAPLALPMGMPFPLGIVRVARDSADLVPWAWGINGCASVVAAVLATLLAIHLGFAAVVLIAVALYLAAPLAFAPRWSSGDESRPQ